MICRSAASDTSSLNKLEHNRDDCQNQKKVNESAHGDGTYQAQSPQNNQYDCDSPKHFRYLQVQCGERSFLIIVHEPAPPVGALAYTNSGISVHRSREVFRLPGSPERAFVLPMPCAPLGEQLHGMLKP